MGEEHDDQVERAEYHAYREGDTSDKLVDVPKKVDQSQ
jgi:hypothetical protein